jgi:hypothetical protein
LHSGVKMQSRKCYWGCAVVRRYGFTVL